MAAATLAMAVLGSGLAIATRRALRDAPSLWNRTDAGQIPPGLLSRVDMVKRRVPKGSLIVYLMPEMETWEFGLWQRSLYPDYVLMPVADSALLETAQFQELRYRYGARYVLLANMDLPAAHSRLSLPDYPGGIRMSLAELGE